VANVALGYAEKSSWLTARGRSRSARRGIDLRERAWFNPDLASRTNVPAVVGMIILLTTMLLTALAVVRERGSPEQSSGEPTHTGQLIPGKTISLCPYGADGTRDL
jgi:ABC-2 type transport system permease protein